MGRKRKVDDSPGQAQPPSGTASAMTPDGDSYPADVSLLRGAPGIETEQRTQEVAQPTKPRKSQPTRGSQGGARAAAPETTSVSNPGAAGETAAATAVVAQWQPPQWPSNQEAALYYQHQDWVARHAPHQEALYQRREALATSPPQQEFLSDAPQQPLQPSFPEALVGAPCYALRHSLPEQSAGHRHMAAPLGPPRPGFTAQPQIYAPAPVPDQHSGPGQMEQQLGYVEEFIIVLRGVSKTGVSVMQRCIQDRERWAAEVLALRRALEEKTALAEQLIWEKAARSEELETEKARSRQELFWEKEHMACELKTENARLIDELESLRTTEQRNVSAHRSKLRLVRHAQARALGLGAPAGESVAAPIDSG